MTAERMQLLLIVDIVAMALFALIYLRQRQLRWFQFCGWLLLAIGLPVFGPFLVIASRPGRFDPNFSFTDDVARLGSFLVRLLPLPPRPTRLARARRRKSKRAVE